MVWGQAFVAVEGVVPGPDGNYEFFVLVQCVATEEIGLIDPDIRNEPGN